MRKQIYLIVIFIISPLMARSQDYQIVTQNVSGSNFMLFDDLWNLSLSYSSNKHREDYYINLVILDKEKNNSVEMNTARFRWKDNFMPINSGGSNIAPLQVIRSVGNILKASDASGGFLPGGNYAFSYTLMGKAANGYEPVAIYTSYKRIFTIPNIQLIHVFDKDTLTLEEKNPVFAWTEVQDIIVQNLGDNGPGESYSYEIEIAEVLQGQTPISSMLSNARYFREANLKESIFQYPYNAKVFSDSGTYAWKVNVFNSKNEKVASSQVWSFTYKLEKKINYGLHVLLKPKNESESYILKDQFLSFAVMENYSVLSNSVLDFRIINIRSNDTVFEGAGLGLPIRKGMNAYDINVCESVPSGLPKGAYLLEVSCANNQKRYLNILVERKINCNR